MTQMRETALLSEITRLISGLDNRGLKLLITTANEYFAKGQYEPVEKTDANQAK